MPTRLPHVHHGTSLPQHFFGRDAELRLLDTALVDPTVSVAAFLGPGGQGKTAIVQHWLARLLAGPQVCDGVFLWSFYRGKDADVCLRELYSYASGVPAGDVSAAYCVDHLLPLLRRERWVLVLDGAEVVQHESGPWLGRFLHPDLGRLLEELAGTPQPGVVVLTSRFPVPELERRHYTRVVNLHELDAESTHNLLRRFGVRGEAEELDRAAAAAGYHPKAVELLATYLACFCGGKVSGLSNLPQSEQLADATAEESRVASVLAAYQAALSQEQQDILALATAFREPPTEERLLQYLGSPSLEKLLQGSWNRSYPPLGTRTEWLAAQLELLVHLRLLERIVVGHSGAEPEAVIDAHPLVRRWFAQGLGSEDRRAAARVRAGFLRGRPDRRRPETLEEAREEVELFHAHCEGGWWNEAENVFVALDNPKHRFLAPALERDLLLRFFPGGNWNQPPLWSGFGRYRSLAIAFEMLGQYDEALTAYREADAPLRGDALLARGKLAPLLQHEHVPQPWDALWQAYRVHALSLTGQTHAAVSLAHTLVPQDVYEWIHIFEGLLRCGQLQALDLRSLLYRPLHQAEHDWSHLARERMRADYLRVQATAAAEEVGTLYRMLLEAYDRTGLPLERVVTRLGYGRWLLTQGQPAEALAASEVCLQLTERHGLLPLAAEAWHLAAEAAGQQGDAVYHRQASEAAAQLRAAHGLLGPVRP